MTALDDLIDSLGFANVYAGQPIERREFAQWLDGQGITAADVDLLAEHVRATVTGAPSQLGVLVALLRDEEKRGLRLVDLREIAARKAKRARQDDRAPGDKPYTPGPTQGEAPKVWEHDRNCRMAACLFRSDRKSVNEIATILGVSVSTAKAMIDRGNVLSQSLALEGVQQVKMSEIQKADQLEEKRRVEFLERMRKARARVDSAAQCPSRS